MKRLLEEPKKEKKKMKKPLKVLLIVVLVLLVLGGVAAGYVHSKLNLISYDDGTMDNYGTGDYIDELIHRIIHGEDPDVQAEEEFMEDATRDLEPIANPPELPTTEIRHDSNVINILLIGTDERTSGFNDFARGDSCMILSLNKSTGSAKLVSLERGMGVPILAGSYAGQWDWLTHTFCYGGADLLMREVRECFRVDVNRYIRVNFNTFQQGIEAIGGVDINLTQAEANYLNEKGSSTTFTAGTHRLYGWAALQYARCRKIDSDWQRIQRQRTVIQAAINRTKHLSVGALNNLLNQVLPLVRTNLTQGEILTLMSLAPKFQGVTFQQMTLPASGTYGSMHGMGGRPLFAVDFNANAKILQDFLYG